MASRRRKRQMPAVTLAGVRALAAKTGQRVVGAVRGHPRTSITASILIGLGLVLGVVGTDMQRGPVEVGEATKSAAPAKPAVEPVAVAVVEQLVEAIEAESAANGSYNGDHWQLVEVRPGQTLERIFRQKGLGAGLLHQVVHLDEHTRGLARIRPGDVFAFDLDNDGDFRALRAELDDERWLLVERNGDGLKSRIIERNLEYRTVETGGTISSSLFAAATAAGLSDNMTMRLANIFGWDVDFALDIRSGDRFALIYQEIWRDGEYLRDGPILAARFVNRGRAFEAVRFDAGDGPDFFAPDGRPMRKAFLRAPLNFSRVTSGFNPRRFHPITRQVRPHNGVDYGAPTGTPVWAAGDGRVIRSAYNNANGNYIFIQHGNHIVTRYLHLSRRDVRVGDRVRQGQTIGAVGATGMATGPHLHYEFLVNGVHRNPRTVDLPDADPLPSSLLDDFKATAEPLLTRMEDADMASRQLMVQADEDCSQAARC